MTNNNLGGVCGHSSDIGNAPFALIKLKEATYLEIQRIIESGEIDAKDNPIGLNVFKLEFAGNPRVYYAMNENMILKGGFNGDELLFGYGLLFGSCDARDDRTVELTQHEDYKHWVGYKLIQQGIARCGSHPVLTITNEHRDLSWQLFAPEDVQSGFASYERGQN